MIFNFTIAHSSKKCEIKCAESRKKLTTQYKFCLMHADVNCPGGGVGSMRKPADKGGGVENRQNLTDVFYG